MLDQLQRTHPKHIITRRVLLKRTLWVSGLGCLLAACSHGQIQGQKGDTFYSIGVRGEENRVTIAPEIEHAENGIVVSIQSPRGLGQASFAWWGSVPDSVHFELPLKGLEQFTLRWSEAQGRFVMVTVGVSSLDHRVLQSVQRDGETAQMIAADSPYWMEVSLPTADANGYQLVAPSIFVMNKPELWTIQWVDFFR